MNIAAMKLVGDVLSVVKIATESAVMGMNTNDADNAKRAIVRASGDLRHAADLLDKAAASMNE